MIPSGILLLLLVIINEWSRFSVNSYMFAIVHNPLVGKDSFFTVVETNILPSLIMLLFLISALLVAFSKEINEDEYISKVRLDSLIWAVLINYLLLLISIIFIYELAFLWILLFNMFTILILFIIRFNLILFKERRCMKNAE
ncbi:hypothetical protein ACFLSQ_07500 [Bacteroidota bacterium]